MSLYRLENVGYVYNDAGQSFRALDEVNITISEGEFVAIVGASGSGKTTMMNLLGLLSSPTEGRFVFDGEETVSLGEGDRASLRNTSLGFVFQHFALLPRLSVLENVMLPYRFSDRLDGPALERRAQELLVRLGLGDTFHNRLPSALSGGQKQRVALCRALLLSPKVLLADEPTGALDSKTTEEVLALFEELHSQGQTIIVITHDPEVAARAARRIVLKDGKVQEDVLQRQPQVRAPASQSSRSTTSSHERTPLSFLKGVAERLRRLTKGVRSALNDLAAHRLRSALTGLGLMIGVASILVIAGLGAVVQNVFNGLFYNAGTSKIYIWFDGEKSAAAGGMRHWKGFDLRSEFPAFASQFARYGTFRPFVSTRSCNVRSPSKPARAGLTGLYDPAEFVELDTGLRAGRFPTALEMASGANVAVLGSDTVDNFFTKEDPARAEADFPLGQSLAIDGCEVLLNLRVIGVLEKRDTTFGQRDANDRIYSPANTLLKSMGLRTVSFFSILPARDVDPTWLGKHVTNYLAARAEGGRQFSSGIPAEFIEKIRGFLLIIQGLTGFIGALCILVGGIGIFNIMIVTVTERVREIGILKSQGAHPHHIRNQFLVESVTLCVLAGATGIVLGLVLTNALAFALSVFQPTLGGFQPVFTPWGLATGLAVSFACGIGFGLIPAVRAGRLEPAACMREE
ncbi:MAG: ATP-binding cassette domain-containing protein [Silvanigrellales bacterium]|nr:ATP-binding cassette domain-containing protein [Silvanigrellales bacterium]